jgi:hypothetical protein
MGEINRLRLGGVGLRSWWRASREKAKRTRRSVAINSDRELIAAQVPELAGMSDVEGMAHTLRVIEEWNRTCTPEEATEFARRLLASQESWRADGMTMPYWGNLWVLRTYEAQLGRDGPAVATPVDAG